MVVTRASRKERLNLSAAAGTNYSVVVYSVSTNRSFILTDLVASTNDPGEFFTLYDGASASTPTASTEKLRIYQNPAVITDLQNGPEFATGVTCALGGNRALPTYSVWVGGFER